MWSPNDHKMNLKVYVRCASPWQCFLLAKYLVLGVKLVQSSGKGFLVAKYLVARMKLVRSWYEIGARLVRHWYDMCTKFVRNWCEICTNSVRKLYEICAIVVAMCTNIVRN